jgi:primosomal protein N'
MNVIEVIPFGRGTFLETLSYFSATTYPPGTIVTIPVRGSTMRAVIINSQPVSSTKTALKAATFSLRKLPEQKSTTAIPDHLLTLITELQKIYPITAGALLYHLIPNDIKNGLENYHSHGPTLSDEDATPTILEAPRTERYISYLSIIRGAFARRGSTLLVTPSTASAFRLYEALSNGIEDRVAIFTPDQSKKQRVDSYQKLHNFSHTILIITTPSHAYIDRTDLTQIIIDESGNGQYTTIHRPHFDHRTILILLAKITKRSVLLGDTVARTEDEYKRRNDIYLTYGETPKRLTLPAKLTIIQQANNPTGEKAFQLFSPELKERIKTVLEARKNIFLFASRRGLAPVIYCIDCGFIFRCPDSGTPYSLMRSFSNTGEEIRWFVSGTSGQKVRAADTCPDCGSWRLRERGIGIQHIENECRRLFPHAPLTIFDTTTASTYKKSTELIKRVSQDKGHILLGTTMALPFIPRHTHLSAVVSLDAARSIPTWRADETLFRLLMTLRENTENEVIVQTRQPVDDLLTYAGRGSVERFHNDEIALREMAHYPPFFQFIFITWQGSKEAVTSVEITINDLLKKHAIRGASFYNNPRSTQHKILRHCLIRIKQTEIKDDFIADIRQLPPYIITIINPDRIV